MDETERERILLILNGQGCKFGARLEERFDNYKQDLKEELRSDYKDRMDNLEKKLDRIFIGIALSAVGLATSAVLLALNLII
jgi:hypothetical protein